MGPAESAYRRRVLDHELDELLQGLPAIAIEGAKAVGKTATASQRAATAHHLDDPGQRSVAEADLDRLVHGAAPVLIDEWQYVPAVWDRVRRAVDESPQPGRFLLTGSASPKGLGTHSGAGRIVSLRMRPMSLAERLEQPATVSLASLLTGQRGPVEGKTTMRIDGYVDEILRSGFPAIRQLDGRALRSQLDAYVARVVDRDFAELGHPTRNSAALRRWMAAYAAATATTTSFEKIRRASTSGHDNPPAKTTVIPYRDVLQRLFLLEEVPGWNPSRNHIAQLGLAPKHHLADPALAANLLGATAETLLGGTMVPHGFAGDGALLGSLFESLVTLSVSTYAQTAEAKVSHLRTRGGRHEVDLIVERPDSAVVALEVKLSATADAAATAHLKWLREQIGDQLLDAVVVTTGDQAYRRVDGIAVVPAALLAP